MLFINYLSSQSSLPSPIGLPFIDKFYHFIEYMVLGILLYFVDLPLIFLIFLGIFYGALDEFHQSFVPLRDPSFWDWVFDFIGLNFGLLGVYFWKKKRS